jgi:hypothetical protein
MVSVRLLCSKKDLANIFKVISSLKVHVLAILKLGCGQTAD